MLAIRTKSLRGQMLVLDDSNQKRFAHSNTANIFPISLSRTYSQAALRPLFVWRRSALLNISAVYFGVFGYYSDYSWVLNSVYDPLSAFR
jgi:hypothetical protein